MPESGMQTLAPSEILAKLLAKGQRLDPESLKRHFAHHLEYSVGKYTHNVKMRDVYEALALTVKDVLIDRYNATRKLAKTNKAKRVYYISMEFLIGRLLQSNLIKLGGYEFAKTTLAEMGFDDMDAVLEEETDAGLGNGGLGRLAACFLDSMSTLDLTCSGSGLYYDYGIFHQRIENGAQAEYPDNWLDRRNPWEIVRQDLRYDISFFGHTEEYTDDKGVLRSRWKPGEIVVAQAFDILIPGYNTRTVNNLRLWKARASNSFNFDYFNHGDYVKAVEDKIHSENITHVLYPNENSIQGKELRLKQEYFLVSATIQDAFRSFFLNESDLNLFPERAMFQLNDTHPALAVAEILRILMDEHGLDFVNAWNITSKCCAYTNHTVMPEALEKWDLDLISRVLPRHVELIYLVNYHCLEDAKQKGADGDMLSRMSVVDERHPRKLRMANLAIMGSVAVNGVAALHTEIIKKDIFNDFYRTYPDKFQNKTNGITHRRWIIASNPDLTQLISEKIGNDWMYNLEKIRDLEQFADDEEFQQRYAATRKYNKKLLAEIVKKDTGIEVDINSMFDVQIKRIHEYKRQHLNVLRIIADYKAIKKDPGMHYQPRTFLFGGKAAPGYHRAKLIIKLIHRIADKINNDPDVAGRMKVVFLPNYRVSLAERMFPASDLSEQTSTAGMEASGTGNMKFMLNGALTVGTLDGANIEIKEEAGDEHIYIFGKTVEELNELRARGYDPVHIYHSNPVLHEVLSSIHGDEFSPGDHGVFQEIYHTLTYGGDYYFLLADFDSYMDVQKRISEDYQNPRKWWKSSVLNTARSGKFSSDRTINQYAKEIWGIEPLLHHEEE